MNARNLMRTLSLSLAIAIPSVAQGFDFNWTRIPKTFRGDNPVTVCKILDDKKGEFETTEQFKKRVGLVAGKTYTFFCLKNPFETTYDADHQEFVFRELPYSSEGLVLAEFVTIGKPYVGTNAFGVKTLVHRKTRMAYSVQNPTPNAGVVGFTLPVAADKAQKLKGDFGIILIIKTVQKPEFGSQETPMMSPLLSLILDAEPATRSSPVDYYSETRAIQGAVQQVVVYRLSDRSILTIKPD